MYYELLVKQQLQTAGYTIYAVFLMRLKIYVLTPDMARSIDLLQFLFMISFHLGLFQGNVEETELGCVGLDFLKCYICVSTRTQPDFSCHTPLSFSNEC